MLVALFASPSFGQAIRRPAEFHPGEGSRFTVEEEIVFGDKGADLVVSRGWPVHDAELERYANSVLSKLVANAPAYARSYHYRVSFLFGVSKTITGYANGHIIIMLPILREFSDENEFATVLAHEIGHIALRHGGILQTIIDQCNADTDEMRKRSASDKEIEVRSHAYSEDYFAKAQHHEFEADAFGIQLALAAGYDPRSATKWLDRHNESDTAHPPGGIRAESMRLEMTAYLTAHPEWQPELLDKKAYSAFLLHAFRLKGPRYK